MAGSVDSLPLSPRRVLDWLGVDALPTSGWPYADVVVSSCSSRNESYLVEFPTGEAYFLKTAASPSHVPTIRHEAGIYDVLGTIAGSDRFAPALVGFDSERAVLILAAVRDAAFLDPLTISMRRELARAATRLADALAFFHGLTIGGSVCQAPLPLVYRLILPPPELQARMSPANLQLVRLLQQDEVLCDSIVASRQSWHATALIHGELKPPHCLVTRPSARGGPTGLTLVDFENAGLGEPGWDVGCVVAAFLGRWVMSISSAAPSHSRVPAARAPVPLPHVQAGIRAFWHAYATQMGLTIGHLERALPHAISRMVWSVFESCTGRNVLPEQALVTLQLAHNLGARPRDGIRYVLGLDGN